VGLQAVAHLDDRNREDRRAAGVDGGVQHPGVEDVARLAAEPALRRDRPQQDEAVQELQVALGDPRLQISAHRRGP
jgi:hypothetical protein